MLSRLRERLTYANVVSTLCLFILLGGTSYAALVISGKNVKNNSLTGKDIKDRSLLAKDFKAGQLPRGVQGPPGPPGPKGDTGEKGADAPPAPPPPAAPDPVDGRLAIEGLGTFPVHSFRWGGTIPFSSGGGGTGQPTFQDLVVSREPDSGSPGLFRAVARGTQFTSATLEVSAPGAGTPAAVYTFADTLVRSLNVSGSGGDREETVSLLAAPQDNFGSVLAFNSSAPALPVQERKIGEMTVPGVSGGINLYSDNWGLFTTGGGGGGGGGVGAATFEDFGVVKLLDSTSPELFEAMASGQHFATVTIRQLQPGTTNVYSTFELTDAQLTSYEGAASLSALEELTFHYTRITQRTPLPGGGEAVTCWDVATNEEC